MKKLMILLAAMILMASAPSVVASDNPIPNCWPCGDGTNQ